MIIIVVALFVLLPVLTPPVVPLAVVPLAVFN